jgi:hypothetical protein
MAFLRKTPIGSKLKRIRPRLKVLGRPQPKRRTLAKGLKPAGLLGVGAIAWYLFDPSRGKGRRKKILDMTAGRFRRGGRRLGRLGRRVGAEAYGVTQKVTHLKEEGKDFDDVTLANKVMSELFGDPEIPKGDVNITAENGTIVLLGQVKQPGQINEIERRVLNINGVQGVRNLLHTPKTPVPDRGMTGTGNGRGRAREG